MEATPRVCKLDHAIHLISLVSLTVFRVTFSVLLNLKYAVVMALFLTTEPVAGAFRKIFLYNVFVYFFIVCFHGLGVSDRAVILFPLCACFLPYLKDRLYFSFPVCCNLSCSQGWCLVNLIYYFFGCFWTGFFSPRNIFFFFFETEFSVLKSHPLLLSTVNCSFDWWHLVRIKAKKIFNTLLFLPFCYWLFCISMSLIMMLYHKCTRKTEAVQSYFIKDIKWRRVDKKYPSP